MNTNESKKKKNKKVKNKTLAATCPQASGSSTGDSNINDVEEHFCPLLAKDSEWVDILQTPHSHRALSSKSTEEVETEDGREPLAIMFPGLLDKDPQTLQNMLTKTMSTTEVTKQLVDLGQKASFKYMKKSSRLIPPEKEWLESVTEINSDSHSSMEPGVSGSSNYKNGSYESYEDTDTKKRKTSDDNIKRK